MLAAGLGMGMNWGDEQLASRVLDVSVKERSLKRLGYLSPIMLMDQLECLGFSFGKCF